MKLNLKAIAEVAHTINSTEARHIIGLMDYYRKFLLVFSDVIQPLNELTRKNVPCKLVGPMSERFRKYQIKQINTTSPKFAYRDPDKQYYLLTDNSNTVSMNRKMVQNIIYPILLHIKVELFRAHRKIGVF